MTLMWHGDEKIFVIFQKHVKKSYCIDQGSAQNLCIVPHQGPRQYGISMEPIDFKKWVSGTRQFLTKLTKSHKQNENQQL